MILTIGILELKIFNSLLQSLLSKKEKECEVVLNEEHVTTMANTLKVLFNCTCAANPEENSNDEELMSSLSVLCHILHLLLTVEKESCELRTAITRSVQLLLLSSEAIF